MGSNFTFQGDFLGDNQAGFRGDFQGLEQNIWGGTEPWMQPMVPDDNVDWSQWMDLGATDTATGPGVMDDWGTVRRNNSSLEANHPNYSERNNDRVYHNSVNGIGSHGSREHSQSGMSESTPLETYRSSLEAVNDNRALSQVPCDDNTHSARPLTKRSSKVSTQRLRCTHPGCKLTFPRNWELQRHEHGVHNPQVAILCPVYGCKRVDKPFPRADKFMEHMRKHSHMYQYLCIFNNCDVSPRTKEELLEHLNAQHQPDCCSNSQQISLDSLGWRQTPLRNGSLLFESKHNSPLAFLGCKYSEAVRTFGKGGWWERTKDGQHLESHNLIDRSKAFEAIERIMGEPFWLDGLATCPICQARFTHGECDLPPHLQKHSQEERMSKATDLAEMFRPLLAGKSSWSRYGGSRFGAMITSELEEAGVIPETDV